MRSRVLLVVCAAAWAIGCGGGERSAETSPPAETAGPAAPAPAVPTAASPGDLFPESPQKTAVIANCASCHNLACSVIGQRTPERWDSLQKSHGDKVPGADVAGMFAYLKANFDSSKPEPAVPPAFLEGGCTPF